MRSLGCRNQAEPQLLIDEGVIACDRDQLAFAQVIAARVANMSHDSFVITQRTGDNRCRHSFSAPLPLKSFIVYNDVRFLNQLLQQAG
jgi:hypothetical protein